MSIQAYNAADTATLAIDQGTTSTRALLVNQAGAATPLLSLAHRQYYPQPGWVEHDADELLANVISCVQAGDGRASVTGVGLSNQGESCLAWDADTGRPVGPVIVWQDDRTRDAIARLQADGATELVRERAGLPLDAYFSAGKLAWILENNADAVQLASRGKLRLGTTDAFFRDRLTGRFETDVTTASRTSLMNLERCEWDDELCRLFKVPMHALPRIVPGTGELGRLSPSVSLCLHASMVDQQAALYGHGCREAGDTKMTFGTGAFALTVTGAKLSHDLAGALPTLAWQKAGESPVYALDGGVYSAASALNWGKHIGLFDHFENINTFDREPAIRRGLAFVPALSGLACPHWDRQSRGSWLGLSLDTDKQDMVQAMLEGIAFRMAEVVTSIEHSQAIIGPIAIDGGMSVNSYFCQFLADVLQRPLAIATQTEQTAMGVAALAAESAGAMVKHERQRSLVIPRRDASPFLDTFTSAREAVQAFACAGTAMGTQIQA